MFASFTSILSPALKEKLGIGPKPSPPPGTCSPAPKPLTLPANRTIRPLSAALQTEVQSPGFSTRVISQVREGIKPHLPDPGLSPLSMSVSSRYSRVGQLPVVTLTKRQLPRLTSRNSEKVGRREGRAPVMMRIAPQEPFSPFKRYPGSADRGGSGSSRGRDSHGGSSTDPRQVIAVLAELSGKRTRRPSDDLSITGSKRARRDSSSSLGSSLSMEMPPLFQNGVVGQSTSHLVSREADLSLGSLLSRNQSLFGHSPLSSHHSHPMPPTSLSHHHSVPTANAHSQTVSAKPETSSDLSLSLEIQASLSSSRCLLKRNRDQLDEDSEDEENVATPRASNVFRSPDKGSDSAIRKRRQSSEGSCKSCGNNSTLVEGDSKSGSPEAGGGGSAITVASPAEILGTPAPKRRRTGQMIGEKELKGERELQRKRLGKMLEIFPDQKALTPKEKSKETPKEFNTEEEIPIAVSKPGGFAFPLGEQFDAPPPAYDSTKGGFPFDFGSKPAAETVEVSASVTVPATISPASTTTTSTPLSLGNISTSNTVTGIPSTTTAPDLLSKSPSKPATVTFNLSSGQVADKTVPAPVPGLPVPKFNLPSSSEANSVTTETVPSIAPTAVTTTAPATPVAFSFADKLAANEETAEKAAVSSVPLTFGAANMGAPAVSSAASIVPATTVAPAVFSFGSTKTAETTKTLPTPSFNFGASAAATTTAATSPTFSLGKAGPAATVPSFGATPAKSEKPFSFGATATPVTSKPEASVAASTGLFTFGAAPAASTVAPAFGTTTAVSAASSVATVTPFSFGATPAAAPATTTAAPSSGLFSFGSTPAVTTTAAATFGSTTTASAAPTFGSTATAPAAGAAASFSFGAAPATTASAALTGGAFSFGAANPPATTTQSTPFAFGKAASEPTKPSFSFGGSTATPAAAANPFGAAAPAPAFGAAPAASGFGAPSSNAFGTTAVSTSANTFGATSVTKSASTGNVFSFGKSATAPQPAAAAASPFSFGAANPPQASAAPATGSPFQFGAASSTPAKSSFSFGGSATSAAAPAFGAQTATSAFGAPSAAATTPAFGGAPVAAVSQPAGVFSFGAAAAPAAVASPPANPNAGFNFSAAPQSAAGVFSFGAAAPAVAPQGNPFGAPANPAPAFGAPSTNFGAAPANFGAASPGFGAPAAAAAPAGASMFSIGAGGQQNRSSNTQRRIATARRTRK